MQFLKSSRLFDSLPCAMIVKAANKAYALFRKLDVADNVRVAVCTLLSVCIDSILEKISKLSHYVVFRLFT